SRDWSSDVCSSDLTDPVEPPPGGSPFEGIPLLPAFPDPPGTAGILSGDRRDGGAHRTIGPSPSAFGWIPFRSGETGSSGEATSLPWGFESDPGPPAGSGSSGIRPGGAEVRDSGW